MSPNRHQYQVLLTFLQKWRIDTTVNQLTANEMRSRLNSLQQLFLEQVAPIVDLDSREMSYRTEISKQLRLLEIDVMFLQGARQATTVQSRMQTIGDRLTTLIQYCQAIVQPAEQGEQ
ncbi:MAG TPA: heterocyst frequency control protein PatD [Nostocaceae cyanobacterium]|nr:heterocyst frequency control protein PatD [Nostocaceae cyanobacterium]